jgi:hypothetical protein
MKFVFFGDFGFENNVTIYDTLLDLTNKKEVDFVVHGGDIAYNIDHECNRVGDDFFNRIQGVATKIPYNIGVGNHETDLLFSYSSFTSRASNQMIMTKASKSTSPRWYSFNAGLVHFVIFDTDAWIYAPVYPLAPVQYAWMEKDLAAVNRTETPWIVVVGHRAM